MKEKLYVVIMTISLMLNVYLLTSKDKIIEKKVVEYVERKDTVVSIKKEYDTVYVKKPEYITKVINDTIYILDKPNEYRFNNSDYDLYVNAVKLNNYKLDIHAKDTITLYETKYIEKTLKENKKPLVTHGIHVGAGYGFINRKPDVYVGYGLQINF